MVFVVVIVERGSDVVTIFTFVFAGVVTVSCMVAVSVGVMVDVVYVAC